MSITIIKPTTTVELVTDLQALRESVLASNDLQTPSAAKAEGQTQTKALAALHALVDRVEDSTLILTLRGLTSSQWNMITVKHSHVENDRIVKDWPAMVEESLPLMLASVKWKTKDAPIDLEPGELHDLIEAMSDTQVQDLMVNIQELNSPVVEVPKAVLALI